MPKINILAEEAAITVYKFLDGLQELMQLRATGQMQKILSDRDFNVAKAALAKYIEEHPELLPQQVEHLKSDVTIQALERGIDTIEGLAKQADVEILQKFITLYRSDIPLEPPISNTNFLENLSLENITVQSTLDQFNYFKMTVESKLVKPSFGLLFDEYLDEQKPIDHNVALYGILSGLDLMQLRQVNLEIAHIEALYKEYTFENIQALNSKQVNALLMGELIEDILGEDANSYALDLCRLGIPLGKTKNEYAVIITDFARYISAIGRRIERELDYKNNTNVLELFERFVEVGRRYIEELDEETVNIADIRLQIYAECSDLYLEPNYKLWLTMEHVDLYNMGYTYEQIQRYFKHEALAEYENISKEKAFTLKQLDYYAVQNINVFLDGIESLNSYQMLYYALTQQLEMRRPLDAIDYYAALKLQTSAGPLFQFTTAEIISRAFDLEIETVNYPCIGRDHFGVLCMLEEQGEEAALTFQDIQNLNGVQVGLRADGLSDEAVRNQFISYGFSSLLNEEKYTFDQIYPLQLNDIQLMALEYTAEVEDVQQPWFDLRHACGVRMFPNLISAKDMAPSALTSYANRMHVPQSLQKCIGFSWEHVIAFAMGIDLSTLKTVSGVAALGLVLGLSIAQAQAPWLTHFHLLLMCLRDDDFCTRSFDEVANLSMIQLRGLYDGLSVTDIQSSWFSPYHVLAAALGYNFEFIRGFSASHIMKMIQSNYSVKLDFEYILGRQFCFNSLFPPCDSQIAPLLYQAEQLYTTAHSARLDESIQTASHVTTVQPRPS